MLNVSWERHRCLQIRSFPFHPCEDKQQTRSPFMQLDKKTGRVSNDTLVNRKKKIDSVHSIMETNSPRLEGKKLEGTKTRRAQVVYAKYPIKRIHFYYLNARVGWKVIFRKHSIRSSTRNQFQRRPRCDEKNWHTDNTVRVTKQTLELQDMHQHAVNWMSDKCEGKSMVTSRTQEDNLRNKAK